MSTLLLWLAKKLGAQIVTQELARKVIDIVFIALYDVVDRVPGEMDNVALLALEGMLDKDKLAATVVEWFRSV